MGSTFERPWAVRSKGHGRHVITDHRHTDHDTRKFCEILAKVRQKIQLCTFFGRHGKFRTTRATRCRKSNVLRSLATSKTSKTRFGKNLVFVVHVKFICWTWRSTGLACKAKVTYVTYLYCFYTALKKTIQC